MGGTIVVGYDGSEPAEAALTRAIEEARSTGGRLTVVTVVGMPIEPEAALVNPQLGGPVPGTRPLIEPPPQVEETFARAHERAEREGVEADLFWDAGDPTQTILDVARERQAAAIVLGSHHHSMLSRLLGADVAAEVKRRAGCDVIVAD